MIVLLIVYYVMSMAALTLYAKDKVSAIEHGWRIPEVILLSVSALGGVSGTIIGMIFLNHKSNMSNKWYFFPTIVISVIVQLLTLLFASGVIVL